MSNWELIDSNPHTGLKKYLGDNPDDPDGLLVKYEVDPRVRRKMLDQNHVAREHINTGKMGDMAHAAHIDVLTMYEWKVKYGIDAWNYTTDPETRRKVNQLLNGEYRNLKVRHIII
jgi:hypothetical protein